MQVLHYAYQVRMKNTHLKGLKTGGRGRCEGASSASSSPDALQLRVNRSLYEDSHSNMSSKATASGGMEVWGAGRSRGGAPHAPAALHRHTHTHKHTCVTQRTCTVKLRHKQTRAADVRGAYGRVCVCVCVHRTLTLRL